MNQACTVNRPVASKAALNPRDRVFKKDAHWFFRTREGDPKGPYIDKQHAYWALAKYIRQQCAFR